MTHRLVYVIVIVVWVQININNIGTCLRAKANTSALYRSCFVFK